MIAEYLVDFIPIPSLDQSSENTAEGSDYRDVSEEIDILEELEKEMNEMAKSESEE